jgi:hypothetical protein
MPSRWNRRGPHFDEDVEIARRTAAQAGLSLARQADAGAGFDAGGDVDVERTVLLHPARAAAGLAGVLDDLADPEQVGQVRSTVKNPCCARTLPMPEQVGQVTGSDPPSEPVPEQDPQATAVGTLICFCRPE